MFSPNKCGLTADNNLIDENRKYDFRRADDVGINLQRVSDGVEIYSCRGGLDKVPRGNSTGLWVCRKLKDNFKNV